MRGFIYLIYNTVSRKGYVGQTAQKYPEQRWKQHKYSCHNVHLRHSLKKYGEGVFEFWIVDEVQADTLDELKQTLTVYEDAWMQAMTLAGLSLYNVCEAEVSRLGMKQTDEAKKKMSDAKRGRPSTFLGKHHSEETKQRFSEQHTGKPRSEESRAKQSATTKGKPKPHQLGIPLSESTRQKMREAKSRNPTWNLGIPRSEETKRKISETKRANRLGAVA